MDFKYLFMFLHSDANKIHKIIVTLHPKVRHYFNIKFNKMLVRKKRNKSDDLGIAMRITLKWILRKHS